MTPKPYGSFPGTPWSIRRDMEIPTETFRALSLLLFRSWVIQGPPKQNLILSPGTSFDDLHVFNACCLHWIPRNIVPDTTSLHPLPHQTTLFTYHVLLALQTCIHLNYTQLNTLNTQ